MFECCTHNMHVKSVALRAASDVPLQASFATGFANLSQTLPSAARHLRGCYALIAVITKWQNSNA